MKLELIEKLQRKYTMDSKSWERWNPNQNLKDCIICMNPSLETWEEMECILRSFFEEFP